MTPAYKGVSWILSDVHVRDLIMQKYVIKNMSLLGSLITPSHNQKKMCGLDQGLEPNQNN